MVPELIRLFLSQFIAYLICNFIVIPSYYIKEDQKFNNKYFRSLAKAIIFLVLSLVLSIKEDFIASSIALSIIVGLTNLLFDRKEIITINFIIIQVIQLIAILIIVHLHNNLFDSYSIIELASNSVLTNKNLSFITGYIFCLGPTNVFIKLLLRTQNLIPEESNKAESLLQAGRFIGNIERIITLTLVFNDQYEAIGLLIAAKSLLRLKENELKMSEYILVGTLLSFGIAIMIGLVIKKIILHI